MANKALAAQKAIMKRLAIQVNYYNKLAAWPNSLKLTNNGMVSEPFTKCPGIDDYSKELELLLRKTAADFVDSKLPRVDYAIQDTFAD